MDMDREQSVQHFLDLIKKSHRGKFKIYIGMIAGVGKSYRMLQEAHELLENGVDVQIGYIETHGRAGTEALMQGLPVIPRRKIFYKGKELEEMDVDAIIRLHPEIVIVDELAHTNVEGSLNEKRWQDVMTLLDEGINVISAINIQHIESVNEEVQEITGIEVKERVPDSVLQEADEVVNIDLTAEELISRLKAGKIYRPEKIQTYVLAVGQDVVCDSPGKQRVTLEYGQAVPDALTDTAFLGDFQPRLDFLNALGRLHGVHSVF